jgi:hypothetical protein
MAASMDEFIVKTNGSGETPTNDADVNHLAKSGDIFEN